MKVKKNFNYEGVNLRIVEREEPYMNGGNINCTRVIAPNGGIIPLSINKGDTLKKIVQRTTELLDGFKRRGADVINELTQAI